MYKRYPTEPCETPLAGRGWIVHELPPNEEEGQGKKIKLRRLIRLPLECDNNMIYVCVGGGGWGDVYFQLSLWRFFSLLTDIQGEMNLSLKILNRGEGCNHLAFRKGWWSLSAFWPRPLKLSWWRLHLHDSTNPLREAKSSNAPGELIFASIGSGWPLEGPNSTNGDC